MTHLEIVNNILAKLEACRAECGKVRVDLNEKGYGYEDFTDDPGRQLLEDLYDELDTVTYDLTLSIKRIKTLIEQ